MTTKHTPARRAARKPAPAAKSAKAAKAASKPAKAASKPAAKAASKPAKAASKPAPAAKAASKPAPAPAPASKHAPAAKPAPAPASKPAPAPADNAARTKAAMIEAHLGLNPLDGADDERMLCARTLRIWAIERALSLTHARPIDKLSRWSAFLVAGCVYGMSHDPQWWIDHHDTAGAMLTDEIDCANWARGTDAARACYTNEVVPRLTPSGAERVRRWERARIANRTYAQQLAVDCAANK